jgi:hypothetical protein
LVANARHHAGDAWNQTPVEEQAMNNEDTNAGTIGHAASTGSERVVTRAHDAADRLKSSAREQVEAVQDRAATGRDHAAERIRRVGSAVRGMGRELRDQDDAFVARYADSIGDGIDRVASYVGSLEPAALADDATRFARSRPAWFFGGAFLMGLAAGRFLKSSRPNADVSIDRQPSADRFRSSPTQSYSRTSGNLGNDISTRGVFDADERYTP